MILFTSIDHDFFIELIVDMRQFANWFDSDVMLDKSLKDKLIESKINSWMRV